MDLDTLRAIFERFSLATGFTTGFVAYPSMKVLIATGWREACVRFHRACADSAVVCKESNTAMSRSLTEAKQLSIHPCRMGLIDGATPIIVRGKFIAYLASGQVFFQPPDLDHYREQARRYGFDVEAYLRAIQAVPVVSEKQFRDVMAFLGEIAVMVAELGLANLRSREHAGQLEAEIAHRKHAEEQRLTLERQVLQVQKLESLGMLAGGIAHDFNNLLTSILGGISLALDRLPQESAVRLDLREAEKAVHHAADLARQMLAYSGRGRFHVQRLDLREVIEDMLHLLQVSVSKRALLRFNHAHNLPAIEADVAQIRQVVVNLVMNASEAIGERSGVIAVSTGAMECDRACLSATWLAEPIPEGLYVYVEVADTGCGIPKDQQARIFDPFYTTKPTGRGLGLAAVMGIVRSHKGAIRLDSEPGKGTTVRVLFPASREPAEALDRLAPEAAGWRGSGLVLLVDDEESIRATGKRMLEYLGFQVMTAADGREAVAVFRAMANEVRCVLLDLTMPHMDGQEAFRALRRIRGDVRVVLASGYNQQDVVQSFSGEELAGFIQKPYSIEHLRSVMARVVGPPASAPRGPGL